MASRIRTILSPVKAFFDARRKKFLLAALLKLPRTNGGITLIDIGAAGDIEPRWKDISSVLNYIGFEPDERSCSLLLKNKNTYLSYQILPLAVWDTNGSIRINYCRKPQVSSYYSPNQSFLALFPDSQRFDVLTTEEIKAVTLDNLPIKNSDFIKLDIQGGELNVLMGAKTMLDNTIGLEIEVEFSSLYINQPLFGEICKFLSMHKIEFIDFVNLSRWDRNSYNMTGQCVFGDALFLLSPENLLDKYNYDSVYISKYLGICLIYNRFDLIDSTLKLLPIELFSEYKDFITAIKSIRLYDLRVKTLHGRIDSIVNVFGTNYRSHLLY